MSDDAREALRARVKNDFTWHPPTQEQAVLMHTLRQRCGILAEFLVDSVPAGRELSTALTKLEEVVMHANAGIVRGNK